MIKNKIINLLQWGQKYTQTDNIYLLKYGSYLSLGDLVSLATAFLLSLAFARFLPKEVFGQYQYLLSVFAILAIFSLEGMHNSVVQSVARGWEGAFKQGFLARFKWGLLGSLVGLGMAGWFWLQNNPTFALAFLVLTFFLPFFKAGEVFQSFLTGKKMFGQRAVLTMAIQILSSLAILAAILLSQSILVLIFTYFLVYCLGRLIATFWLMKKMKPNQDIDPQGLNYGKHLSLMNVLTIIAGQIDKILLFYFLGPAQLAIYFFATIPIQYLRGPLQNLQELALPKFAAGSTEEIKKSLPKKLAKSLIFIGAIIIIYVILVPYFYQIFYPQYQEAIFYSQIFSLDLLVFPISMMMIALCAKMKTKELYKINIINPVTEIILITILTALYGIIGAIIAKLLSRIFYFFVARFYFKKM